MTATYISTKKLSLVKYWFYYWLIFGH